MAAHDTHLLRVRAGIGVALSSLMRKRILIADDESHTRELLGRVLGDRYDVSLAEDGKQGLALALQAPPDLIVSDITMPNMSGLEMAQRIREAAKRSIPVIFLTARDRPQDVIAGIRAGARHYLTKPIQLDDLENRVRRALG
jgi:DNA-binding response OmpR family regulator